MDLTSSWPYIEDTARNRLAHNKTSHHIYEYGDSLELLGVAGEIVARRFLGLSEELHCGYLKRLCSEEPPDCMKRHSRLFSMRAISALCYP